jgi:hypothetical protein
MKTIALVFLAAVAFAQTPVQVVGGPATQRVLVVTGSNVTAICEALSVVTTGPRAAIKVAISGVSKAAAAVVTSAAHGFDANSRPQVTISGATGTGWTGINGTWTATVTGVDTFTIPVNSAGFDVLAGTVIFTTTAPRKSVAEWSVQRLAYDGANNLIWTGWLNGTSAKNQACTNASSTTLNQQ